MKVRKVVEQRTDVCPVEVQATTNTTAQLSVVINDTITSLALITSGSSLLLSRSLACSFALFDA